MQVTQTSVDMAPFLTQLSEEAKIDVDGLRLLHASGARTPEGIYALLQNFPSAAKVAGISSPKLSTYVVSHGGPVLQAMLQRAAEAPKSDSARPSALSAGYGALAPPMSLWQRDKRVPWPPEPPPPSILMTSESPGKLQIEEPVDVRGCLPWPVKNQGGRGTCVSFATTALREQLACEQGEFQDLSEQFLYWDIKTNSPDSNKGRDGTWIEFAFESLGRAGICLEAQWPYNGVKNNTNISQGSAGVPSSAVKTAALRFAHRAATYQRPSVPTGCAQLLLNFLIKNRRPVAISVPVFSDPTVPQSDNWAT
jgi:hypothetical protein